MRLTLLTVGKLRDRWVAEGCAEYMSRLRGRFTIEIIEVKRDAEVLARLPARQTLWVLDERGEQATSRELAARLERVRGSGGAGLTLPHRLARVVVLEQIYRATSILAGAPYHHD